jgi:hypothetical protein
MSSGIFYRSVRARDQLELFLLSAATSLLAVRFYLYLTGYPQIGSGGLHIAHMLWGGALMLAALVVALSFLGARTQRVVAVVGGVGFGVFIDELGKFITRDNNYFYKPTIGIIYAIFIILYLMFNFLSRGSRLTSREYQLNALAQLEEAIVHDMDPEEKERVRRLLTKADQTDPITQALQKLLHTIRTIPLASPSVLRRAWRWLQHKYHGAWHGRSTNVLVRTFFLCEVLLFVGGGVVTLVRNIDSVFDLFSGKLPFSAELAIGQLVSSLVAAAFAAYGALLVRRSRLLAYEQFRRATLVNIFLTQFFMFSRIQFGALPGFVFNLLLLGFISYAMIQHRKSATPID